MAELQDLLLPEVVRPTVRLSAPETVQQLPEDPKPLEGGTSREDQPPAEMKAEVLGPAETALGQCHLEGPLKREKVTSTLTARGGATSQQSLRRSRDELQSTPDALAPRSSCTLGVRT